MNLVYAFGMPTPGRKAVASTDYQYGFNSKRKENEIAGTGNDYDFGARIYDSRLGRWLSLDPLMQKYPELSPYNFCANNPIYLIDPDGKRIIIHEFNSDGVKVASAEYKNGKIYNLDGTDYKGKSKYILKVKTALDNLKAMDDRTNEVVSDLEASDSKHTIGNYDKPRKKILSAFYNREDGTGTFTKFDPDNEKEGTKSFSDNEKIGHELKHAWNKLIGIRNKQLVQKDRNDKTSCEEVDAVNFQNVIRYNECKEPINNHGEGEINKEDLIPANDYKLQKKSE